MTGTFYIAVYGEPSKTRLGQLEWVSKSMGARALLTLGHGANVGRYPHFDDVREVKGVLGPDYTWVPLELTPRSIPLGEFTHPEKAIYVLGAQIHTIPVSVLRQMPRPVVVETHISHTAILPTVAVAGITLHHRLVQMAGVEVGAA